MHLTLPDATPEGEVDLKVATLRELEKILASDGFAKAERMRRFLTYAVEHTLSHELTELKESVIGVEVFDRPASYDPKSDPIVRIEARRLRDKLAAYYERDGQHDSVRIGLPKGGYAVVVEILGSPDPPPPGPLTKSASATDPGVTKPALDLPRQLAPYPAVLPQSPTSPASFWATSRFGILAVLTVTLVSASIVLWQWRVHDRAATPLAVRVFTSLPGAETEPAISADGSKVAFVWTAPDSGQQNIYIQSVDRFVPVVVTTEAEGAVSSPVWSPDGRAIAFLRPTGLNRIGIFSIDLTTRHVTQRGEIESPQSPIGPAVHLDWSPDGRYFATTHRRNLVLISTETGAMKQITSSSDRALGHYDPVFSPDGRQIAFRQAQSFGVDDLYVVDSEGGSVFRLTYGNYSLHGHTWTPDGKSLVFARQRSLWRVPVTGGEPRRLTDGTVSALRPVASRVGGHLVFASPKATVGIWRVPLNRPGKPEQVLASTLTDVSPDVSPDGRRIAFRSDRSGSDEIWLANADGTSLRRLTAFGKPLTGCPRWSPDGKYIALDSRPHGEADLFVVTVSDGSLRRFTEDPDDEVVPSWSRDGQFIYFSSDRTGTWQIWKQPFSHGPAIQVTRGGGFGAWESPDGQWVYYAKDRAGFGLWRVPVNGGVEQPVLPGLEPGMWGNWRLAGNSIVFAESHPPYRIRSVDLRTMRETELGHLPSAPLAGDAAMALSPNGEWLYTALPEPLGSDLFLVDQFR